jgi:hypothetical protein
VVVPTRIMLAMLICATGIAGAQAQNPRQTLSTYAMEDLYQRLILADYRQSLAFEDHLERAGGVVIAGVVGEISSSPNGDLHIWLRHSVHGELVGRFRIPSETAKGSTPFPVGAMVELTCIGVYRSYAQVSARSCAP